jgi:acetylcholinesterase
VSRSIQLGEPVIYVAANYRLNGALFNLLIFLAPVNWLFLAHPGFGFLGGKEVKAAGVGNLGLQDRRCLH